MVQKYRITDYSDKTDFHRFVQEIKTIIGVKTSDGSVVRLPDFNCYPLCGIGIDAQ